VTGRVHTAPAGQLSAAQVTRAFRHAVTPPGVRLRTRATGGGYQVDIPSASAGHAGIHPRNDPSRQREAVRYLEAHLSRAAGVPVTIRSVTLLRGGHTVRVTVGPGGSQAAGT
jgi:hypothetical protein